MWKEAPPTRKKEVLSSHLVESSRQSLTTVSLHVIRVSVGIKCDYDLTSHFTNNGNISRTIQGF